MQQFSTEVCRTLTNYIRLAKDELLMPAGSKFSRTRTIVRECCDDASQWENWKFDRLSRRNALPIVTKSCTRDYVMVIYRHPKFDRDPSRGFFSPYARNCASKFLLGFFWGEGSFNDLQPRRLNRFSRVIRQTTRFRARMCLFGVRRQKN